MAFFSRIARILLTVLMLFAGPPALLHPAAGALSSADGHASASDQSAIGVVPFAGADTDRHAQMQPNASGCCGIVCHIVLLIRSEEHTSELQSLMRISYAVFCLKKKKEHTYTTHNSIQY